LESNSVIERLFKISVLTVVSSNFCPTFGQPQNFLIPSPFLYKPLQAPPESGARFFKEEIREERLGSGHGRRGNEGGGVGAVSVAAGWIQYAAGRSQSGLWRQ
jgi:hypothetical protein